MNRKIPVAALDGSLRNFGVSLLTFNLMTGALEVEDLRLLSTEKATVKSVRASSDNLFRAKSISDGLVGLFRQHKPLFTFVEVPSGGQSYSAVLGFGIVIGIYGSLHTTQVVDVSPTETKMATVGYKGASKAEMIEWAAKAYPNAPWLRRKLKGEMVMMNDNEHLADAVAIAHAGVKTPMFQQAMVAARSLIA